MIGSGEVTDRERRLIAWQSHFVYTLYPPTITQVYPGWRYVFFLSLTHISIAWLFPSVHTVTQLPRWFVHTLAELRCGVKPTSLRGRQDSKVLALYNCPRSETSCRKATDHKNRLPSISPLPTHYFRSHVAFTVSNLPRDQRVFSLLHWWLVKVTTVLSDHLRLLACSVLTPISLPTAFTEAWNLAAERM